MINTGDFESVHNRHYITTDVQGRITSGWSDGPHRGRDTTGAICINTEGGYQFRLVCLALNLNGDKYHQQTEENPPLYTMDGIPLYKYVDGEVMARTEEEIAADRAALSPPPPSAQEQLRADVDELSALVVDQAYILTLLELGVGGGDENAV